MKKFFKNFSLVGFLMLTLCVLLGVGDVSGAVFTADGAAAAGNLTPDVVRLLVTVVTLKVMVLVLT